jgi:hypothetical protein
MAAPNIVNVSSIIGMTTAVGIANTNTSNILLSNTAASGKVFRIISITASNKNSSFETDLTVKYCNQAAGAGTSFSIVSAVPIPANSTLVVSGKETPIYLEEDKSIISLASSANDIDVICSYEDIS